VGEHDDARVLGMLREVGREPGELRLADARRGVGDVVDGDEVHALVVERVVRLAEGLLARGAMSSEASCSPGMKRTLRLQRPRDLLNSARRFRRSFGSSVVCVRSPVNTMKSGCGSSALAAAIALEACRAHRGSPRAR
jgi:hypothetical protein